jgi:ligand-binding SRPBCC domain-containing protein
MLRGPFPQWRHEHRFAELPGGRTELTDHVEYELPAGALGRIANAVAVRHVLHATFASRQRRTRALLEAAP